MQTWLRQRSLWTLTILLVLTGCAGALTGTEIVGDYCRIAVPITYDSKVDTPDTVTQIETHNSRWACVCDNDCPKAP